MGDVIAQKFKDIWKHIRSLLFKYKRQNYLVISFKTHTNAITVKSLFTKLVLFFIAFQISLQIR